ncbi:MAG TPA: alanyl-tRNA editing protein [Acidobacteriaceae bacterium]|nr:alanyl-tRNA editing protein [Acidobacteriaceae bacterium]
MNAASQGAKRLYYDSAALEFTATVTDIRLDSRAGADQLWQVALDRTAFYPEGGGQPWDTGTLVAVAPSGTKLEVPVERVEEDEHDEVWHFVRKPLVAGTEVTGTVDAARRSDHEQQHSGQHLLSAMFLREIGAKTVSFHLGAESSTIDLALREGSERITDDDLRRVEEAANRVALEGRPMISHWVEQGLAEAMLERGDLRKLPEREGPFRIVQMQGIEFNACGGTHVANTSAIGSTLLRKIEKVRQGWRVEFVCGLRAVRTARKDFALLGEAAQTLSVGANDVPARVAAVVAEAKAQSKREKDLLGDLVRAETGWLDSTVVSGALIEAYYQKRDIAFAMAVARGLQARGRGSVIGFQNPTEGGVVYAKSPGSKGDAGTLMRGIIAGRDVKGGGSTDVAQLLCDPGSQAFYRGSVAAAVKHAEGIAVAPATTLLQ